MRVLWLGSIARETVLRGFVDPNLLKGKQAGQSFPDKIIEGSCKRLTCSVIEVITQIGTPVTVDQTGIDYTVQLIPMDNESRL